MAKKDSTWIWIGVALAAVLYVASTSKGKGTWTVVAGVDTYTDVKGRVWAKVPSASATSTTWATTTGTVTVPSLSLDVIGQQLDKA